MRLVTFERLTGDIIVEQSGLMGREIRRGPGIRGQRGRCSKWWRSNVSAANIPQNRRTDVVYCISSWWRDISAVTVDPLGYPQMWRKPHSPSTSIYIYTYYIEYTGNEPPRAWLFVVLTRTGQATCRTNLRFSVNDY